MLSTATAEWRDRRLLVATPVIAMGSFAAGVLFAAVAARVGPLVAAAIPIALAVAVATLTRPLLPLLLVVAAIPFGHRAIGPIQAIEGAALFAIAAIAIAQVNRAELPVRFTAPTAWLGLFLALGVIAVPSALDTGLATLQMVQLCVGALLVGAVVVTCPTVRHVRRVTLAFLAVGGGCCVLALGSASQLDVRAGGASVGNRATAVFTQPNQLGGFAALVLVLAVAYWAAGTERRERLVGGAAAFGAAVALALALSRGAWIGASLGLLALAVLLRDVRRRLVVLAVPAVVIALAMGALRPEATEVQAVRDRVGTFTRGGSGRYDNRPFIWREAMRQIKDDPWTGQGPGNFPVASLRWQSAAQTGAYHAHNIPLTIGAEFGLPALAAIAAFVVALAAGVARAVRSLPRPQRPAVAGLGAGLLAIVGQGAVDFIFRNPVIFVVVWTTVGLLCAALRAAEPRPSP